MTMGTSVVRRSRRASSRPMPREAGVTRAQGCILLVYEGWTVHRDRLWNRIQRVGSGPGGTMRSRNDDIV